MNIAIVGATGNVGRKILEVLKKKGLAINNLYLFVCPLIMNLMFSLITCQMMDNRSLERRPDYADYMKSTRQLIIWRSN